MAKYDVRIIADFFLQASKETQTPITPQKLMGMCIIVYSFYIARRRERLFDAPIVAWEIGPVIPKLWQFVDRYKDRPIDYYDGDLNTDLIDTDTRDLLNATFVIFAEKTRYSFLQHLTSERSAWYLFIRNKGKANINQRIDDSFFIYAAGER